MLLRSITKHVEEQNWFAVLLDFLIVVVGVFIGIQVANWNELQKTRQNEEKTLATLQADFTDHEQKLIERMERSRRLRNECGQLRELVRQAERPKAEDRVEELIFSCMSTSWGLSPPASFMELMSAGNLSQISDRSIRKALIEYGQVNALWSNVDGQVAGQNSEHSKFRQALKLRLFDLDSDPAHPDFKSNKFFSYDWELMKGADTSIGTIVKMHFDQYDRHKKDLEAVRKILTEFRTRKGSDRAED